MNSNKSVFLFFFLMLYGFFDIKTQSISYGLIAGVNFSPPNTTFFIKGEEQSIDDYDYIFNGVGLLGFSIKGYSHLPITDRFGIQLELGYELMRYKSHYTSTFGQASIHNIALSVAPTVKLYKNWSIQLGTEIVYRSNTTSDTVFSGGLNGQSVNDIINPIHLQGFAQLCYRLPNDMSIGIGGIFPRLKSVVVYYIGVPQNDYLVIGQLRVFRLNVGVALDKFKKLYSLIKKN